jgi:DNA-binding NarL/FixJ family response regulator
MSPVSALSAPVQTIRSVEAAGCGIVPQMNQMNRIAIVEDKNVIRAGFERLVGELDGCICVGAFANAEEALRQLPLLQPDIVIMDIHLPNLSGIECTARLKALLPKVRILMVTVYEDEEKIFSALKAGASGYILKRSGPEEIVEAIEELRRGGAPMTSAIARRYACRSRSVPPRTGDSGVPFAGRLQQEDCPAAFPVLGHRALAPPADLRQAARPGAHGGGGQIPKHPPESQSIIIT